MKQFYQTLSEKDQRRYAAVEALKLGHGGQMYVAGVLGCHRSSIRVGIEELTGLPRTADHEGRIRKEGGGRKAYTISWPDIDAKFLDVLVDHTAGDPMDEQVRWTNLSAQEIADRLAQRHDLTVSETVTRQLLAKHGYRRRKIQKSEDER
jgi:Rhodopirellula transposase DDE domain